MVISYTSSNRFVIHIFPKPNSFNLIFAKKGIFRSQKQNLQKNHQQKSEEAELGGGFNYLPVNQHGNGISPFLIGNTCWNCPLFISMLVYQRVFFVVTPKIGEMIQFDGRRVFRWVETETTKTRWFSNVSAPQKTPTYQKCALRWQDHPRTCKCLITMVSQSPKGCSPSKWPV